MKKMLLLVFILCTIFILTACWDYKDIENLGIVAGVAIDKTDDGRFLISAEVLDEEGTGISAGIKPTILEAQGDSILDAIRNVIITNSPKLYFGQVNGVIFSKETAAEGVIDVIDFLSRDAETRLNIELFVSESESAKEVLEAKTPTSEILSFEIEKMLEEQKSVSKAFPLDVNAFVKALGAEGVSPIMTAINIEEKDNEKLIRLCGTAVFKQDKLLGFIHEEETKMLAFILNEVKGGVLVVKALNDERGGNITLEILESKTKIKPIYSENELSIEINIETIAAIDEYGAKYDYNKEEVIRSIEKVTEEKLKIEIESFISKVQKEFNSDIFGFGNYVYRALPEVWKKQGNEWDNLFKNLKVTVKTKVEFKGAALLSHPIEMEY